MPEMPIAELPEGMYSETFKVESSDIDVLEHVNNRVYLRWIEEVATNHSAKKGYDAKRYLEIGCVWVAREHWIEYLRLRGHGNGVYMGGSLGRKPLPAPLCDDEGG